MTNKHYKNGAAKERRIRKKLLKLGCDIAFRSAGSHSAIDVVGIKRKTKFIILLQSKPRSMSKSAKVRIAEKYSWLNGTWRVRFFVE